MSLALSCRMCGHCEVKNATSLMRQHQEHVQGLVLRKLLQSSPRRPRVILTDKIRSYGAAKKVVLPRVTHRQSRYLDNRAENSHQPTRQRERRMKRFKSPEHAQRFLEVHDIVAAHFRPKRHLLSAADYQTEQQSRFETWRTIVAA